jgi:hypothetical protein
MHVWRRFLRWMAVLAVPLSWGCASPPPIGGVDQAMAANDLTSSSTMDLTAPPAADMAMTGMDLAGSGDMAMVLVDAARPPDLGGGAVDMTPTLAPPNTSWLSSGGGSFTGPSSSSELNLSIGGTPVYGTVSATSGTATLTFGAFTSDIY